MDTIESLKAERDEFERLYENERQQRQMEVGSQEFRGNTVSYIYDKCRGYGAKFDEKNAEIQGLCRQLDAQARQIEELTKQRDAMESDCAELSRTKECMQHERDEYYAENERLTAERSRSRAALELQDITTAPKDSTEVLVFGELKGRQVVRLAHWTFDCSGEHQPAYGPAWFYWNGCGFAELDFKPTHWTQKPIKYATNTHDTSRRKVEDFITLQNEIEEWANKTFPQSTPESATAHLLDEARELVENPQDPEEMADVGIILMHHARRSGVDLLSAIRDKFEKCKLRDWGTPDARGVVKHIPQSEPKVITDATTYEFMGGGDGWVEDPPCDNYDKSGPGAGVEIDGEPQCASCGHARVAHEALAPTEPTPEQPAATCKPSLQVEQPAGPSDSEMLDWLEAEWRQRLGFGWAHSAACSVHRGEPIRDALRNAITGAATAPEQPATERSAE